MQKIVKFAGIGLTLALLAAPCFSQTEPARPAEEPTKYFRLDFVVKELEGGKVVNARDYSTSASTRVPDGGCSIRTGEKIPTQTGKEAFTYLDVGVNIDCNSLRVVGDQLALYVSADISGLVSDAPNGPGVISSQPVIRQNRWHATVLIPLRKPTTLFSSDGTTTKRQTQLELTATPIP